ncbi:hypothetical protein MGN70_013499 [Eutypa lata]|nr:hypothetical protein MGN70_013499 [Eutypa lata]
MAITSKLATQPLHKVWQQISSGPGLANPHGQGPASVGASAHQVKMTSPSETPSRIKVCQTEATPGAARAPEVNVEDGMSTWSLLV